LKADWDIDPNRSSERKVAVRAGGGYGILRRRAPTPHRAALARRRRVYPDTARAQATPDVRKPSITV
jgi:hypothetical protein